MLKLTDHAQTRSQQRGISPDAIGIVVRYGRERHCGAGYTSCALDRQGRARASAASEHADQYRKISSRLDFYVILDGEGQVVTVAWPNGHRPGRKHRRVKQQ